MKRKKYCLIKDVNDLKYGDIIVVINTDPTLKRAQHAYIAQYNKIIVNEKDPLDISIPDYEISFLKVFQWGLDSDMEDITKGLKKKRTIIKTIRAQCNTTLNIAISEDLRQNFNKFQHACKMERVFLIHDMSLEEIETRFKRVSRGKYYLPYVYDCRHVVYETLFGTKLEEELEAYEVTDFEEYYRRQV